MSREGTEIEDGVMEKRSGGDTKETEIYKPKGISLVPVEHSVEGEPVGPAGGEVEDVDLAVGPGGLSHPAQQDLLTVGLLQV